MTRSQTKALLPVLVAWSEGRTIQSRFMGGEWHDVVLGHDFSRDDIQWRVKPQPREFWVFLEKDSGEIAATQTEKPWPETIKRNQFNIIHCREVTDAT